MKRKSSRLQNPFVGYGISVSTAAPRVAIGALALLIGLAAVSAPPRAAATPIIPHAVLLRAGYTVYLYNADNTPVVAPNASIGEGGVYTDAGFVGTLDTANRIVDVSDVVVGYVEYQVPEGP